ncbi:fructosamine kinase family protein [Crocinitomix catalasitica]|uniref:fructosamine kinase family protein n=1 Tax=Crocinitomix catalasitica TaxID=184607 RepID=UPI00146FC3A7|nr:fructosamine kinase family protein [Crocinitomix catalasitica]
MKELFDKILPGYTAVSKLAGGDINQVFKVDTANKSVVVKINKAEFYPNMFALEKGGLQLLGSTIDVPEVKDLGLFEDQQYLVLDYIEQKEPVSNYWKNFANSLSNLHQVKADKFGLDESNFIGSLVQQNNQHDNWADFLINERLMPMVEMAVNNGDVNFVEAKVIEKFYKKIPDLYPVEKPTLLHGDLWSGNIIRAGDKPFFIDPAVYYGHREMDIGMMHLFGGFDKSLFHHYDTFLPLEQDWEKRIKYNQVYPLLVHVNLFGRSYWDKVANILEAFK